MNTERLEHYKQKIQQASNKFRTSLVDKGVLYYDGDVRDLSGERVELEKQRRVVLLSPQHYFVRSKEYPLESKKELMQVLALEECEFPQCDTKLYSIRSIDDGSAIVDFWEFSSTLLEKIGENCLLIPATYVQVLSKVFDKQVIKVEFPRIGYLIHQAGKRVNVTSQPNMPLAMSMLGLSDDVEVATHTALNYIAALSTTLLALPLESYSQLIKQFKGFPQFNAQRFAVAFVLGGGITLGALFAFSHYQLQSKTEQLNALQDQVTQTFALKRQSENLEQGYHDLVSAIPQESVDTSEYWQVMAGLYALKKDINIRVRFHRYRDGVYMFSIVTNKATDVLKYLHDDSRISVQQKGDIARTRGGETITVELKLKSQQAEKSS